MTVGFISLGCAKNLVDSQVMAGVLLSENLQLAPAPEQADIILINTCAFIEDARTEAAEAILRACRHKAAGGCRAVIVAGCMAQRYRERLRETFPDVDAFLGVDELERVAEIVRQVAAGGHGVVAVAGAPQKLFRPRLPALRFTGGPFAYLKVAEGCNHACAFCAIPGIRGRYRSRGVDELVAEARTLLDSGVRELNLISQDTTSYGRDLAGALAPGPWMSGSRGRSPSRSSANGSAGKGGRASPRAVVSEALPALLRALDGLEGDFWLRILYGYPSRVTDELLEVMASSRHVAPYLDLPIQHSHPEMLRAMRRSDTLRAVAELPVRLRRAVPGLVLRTTCLVGFPGETEAHFHHLLDYVAEARFDHLGAFAYSPEEGTPACDLPDAPSPECAAERRHRLLQTQQRIVAERRRGLAGHADTALLLQMPDRAPTRGSRKRPGGPLWIARLPRQAPDVDGVTRVTGVPAGAQPGAFVRVRITGGRAYDLTAAAATDPCPEGSTASTRPWMNVWQPRRMPAAST